MRKDDDFEDWEPEAHQTYAVEANNEFTRLKLALKRKAGLLPLPLHTRAINAAKRLLARVIGFCRSSVKAD